MGSKKTESSKSDFQTNFKDACSKCFHRKTCKKPCYFVQKYLKYENRGLFEVDYGPFLTIIHPVSQREIRESSLMCSEDEKLSDKSETIFSDEKPSPFVGAINTDIRQTGIFIDRFFYRKSIKEIAEKYKIAAGGVPVVYGKAQKRILEVVGAMNRQKVAIKSREQIAQMPTTVQYFLLHALFNLNSIEIAEIFDVNDSNVRRGIRQVRDKVIAGELDILEYTDKEKLIAQEKLEKDRSKKREYMKRKHDEKKS